MRNIFGVTALVASSLLVACGGGGGSPGETKLPYSITVTAAKTQLPINISNQPASIGAYARYTTTLYVEARKGDSPIPGGEEIFGCNLAQGLDSGALYYLDGDDEHEDDDGNPLAYRSVTLGANSGGNSFHFHAGTKSGVARVVCSVTNPADKQVYSAYVDIVVGAATGMAASVMASAQAPGYLGTRANSNSLRDNVGIQAFVMDDANQPIPDPTALNLQVSIRSFGASAGARLFSGDQAGSVVHIRTIGGTGLFSLSSGPSSGVVLLELTADRFDNNVSNGIQDPISTLKAVDVVDTFALASSVIQTASLPNAKVGVPFAYALEAKGGMPPYRWSVSAGLPNGLSVNESGVIQGIPTTHGEYNIVVSMRDTSGAVAKRNIPLSIDEAELPPTPPTPPTTPTLSPLVISGCGGSSGTVCQLPEASAGQLYQYAFSATGGDITKPVVWAFTPASPAWLTTVQVGNNGVISGTPANPVPAAECLVKFLVTATRDSISESRPVAIKVLPLVPLLQLQD